MKYIIISLIAVIGNSTVLHAQCPLGATWPPKTNRLFLYFPTTADNTFGDAEFGQGSGNPLVRTRPLRPFNVADLDPAIGTTDQLRNRVFQIVTEDYCEFNVEVIQTTTNPNPAGDDWNVVGIGTDFDPNENGLFGLAQNADLNNSDRQDFARVWARSFREQFAGAGQALNGANSTLQRWATAIGHTTSHEAGHNYGLGHGDSAPRAGEDDQNNHIMATGGTGLTGEMRAGRNRHFSDKSYEILGHNVGLNIKTLYNWDFTNPNSTQAHSLVITLLSTASALTINWSYSGSPWASPAIANTGATRTFQGTVYNVFNLTFNTPKAWSGGSNGIVPAGAGFHVGVTFSESNPVFVYETRLRNSSGTNLDLYPRVIGFNTGAADLNSGDFNVSVFNPTSDNIVIRDVRVGFLPRMASIESMLRGRENELLDIRGIPVTFRSPKDCFTRLEKQEVQNQFTFRLAKLTDGRFVDERYDSTNCKKGFRKTGAVTDAANGEVEYCPHGTALSLFPSTYIYISATVVVPNAEYYDTVQKKIVRGDMESRVYYQFAGIVPDFNKNGVDDLLDIRAKTSIDENKNGIPDESEKAKKKTCWLKRFLNRIFKRSKRD
jgi:hypothetical protein